MRKVNLLTLIDIKAQIPTEYIGKFDEMLTNLDDTCVALKEYGTYINKGEAILVIKNIANHEIVIISPYSGYIKYEDLWRYEQENDSIVVSFLKHKYELDYDYSLYIDNIDGSTKIGWHNNNAKFDCQNQVFISLNIKENKPCLHFRYKKFSLKLNDKIFFLSGYGEEPFIDFTVISKEYVYSASEKIKGVDLFLTFDDVKKLEMNDFEYIIIRFNNNNSPITISTIKHNVDFIGRETDTIIRSKNIFKQYASVFCMALQDAGIPLNDKGSKDGELIALDKSNSCSVYLMYDCNTHFYKIGISKSPNYREKTLQSERPVIELLSSKEYPSRRIAEAIESALHKVFAEKRVRGEWFELNSADVLVLKETLK